ncbi:hypothetical protein AB0F43_31715 [Kribbella sp. NPDC023972]|uniref:hypothetical protein n=1 Tax=Kribbella sp. NPDC023972 TaxID=3154795 RepID=UPI0033EA3FBB
MSTTTAGLHPASLGEPSLVGSLNNEWSQLCTSAQALSELASWHHTEPALSSVDGLEDLPEATRRDADGVLGALIRLAQSGSGLAGRAVVQLMLPKIVLMARSQRRCLIPFEDAASRVVAAMWEQIMCYPLAARPRRIASNLALDSLKHVTEGVARDNASQLGVDDELLAQDRVHDEEVPAGIELLGVLARATARGVITKADARLLAKVYIESDYRAGAAVAQELQMSRTDLRKRCSRLTLRLRANADVLAA